MSHSAAETFVSSLVEKLKEIQAIDSIERDRVQAIDKSEGVVAVIEIESEEFEKLGSSPALDQKLASQLQINIHLMCWDSSWQSKLDEISCLVSSKVSELKLTVDGLALLKRQWTPRQTDEPFGVLTMTYQIDSACLNVDLSKII